MFKISPSPWFNRIVVSSLLVLGLALLILVFRMFTSASSTYAEIKENTLGTQVEIKIAGKNASAAAVTAAKSIRETSNLLDHHNPNSEISLINNLAGIATVATTPTTFGVLKLGKKMGQETNGAFDITIGPLPDLWKTARQRKTLPDQTTIESRRSMIDYRNLIVDDKIQGAKLLYPGMKIDLGGIGKGYAFDLALQKIKKYRVDGALLSCGSSILAVGKNTAGHPWKIAIRNPRFDPKKAAIKSNQKKSNQNQPYLGYIELSDQSLSTSGDYLQFVEIGGSRYTHILNPKTGYPVDEIESVTIICKSAALADAYSTAVMVMGVKAGLHFINFTRGVEGMIVDANGKIHTSLGFKLLQ